MSFLILFTSIDSLPISIFFPSNLAVDEIRPFVPESFPLIEFVHCTLWSIKCRSQFPCFSINLWLSLEVWYWDFNFNFLRTHRCQDAEVFSVLRTGLGSLSKEGPAIQIPYGPLMFFSGEKLAFSFQRLINTYRYSLFMSEIGVIWGLWLHPRRKSYCPGTRGAL